LISSTKDTETEEIFLETKRASGEGKEGIFERTNGTREISVSFIHPVNALSARVKKRSPLETDSRKAVELPNAL
jgi:hypothetical protein